MIVGSRKMLSILVVPHSDTLLNSLTERYFLFVNPFVRFIFQAHLPNSPMNVDVLLGIRYTERRLDLKEAQIVHSLLASDGKARTRCWYIVDTHQNR